MVESKQSPLKNVKQRLIPLQCLLLGVIHDEMYEVERTETDEFYHPQTKSESRFQLVFPYWRSGSIFMS